MKKLNLSRFPRIVLHAGTHIYHGTDCVGDLSQIVGPAWFAHNWNTAKRWAGWTGPIAGRQQGEKRVITYQVTSDIELFDTNLAQNYYPLAELLCGDPEIGLCILAARFAEFNLNGWLSSAEIMLCKPLQHICYKKECLVTPSLVTEHRPFH